MPTGPKHYIIEDPDSDWATECRCMIGEDHDPDGGAVGESLGSYAEDIYMSSGQDEDYDFR